jgi:hypothetical protein
MLLILGLVKFGEKVVKICCSDCKSKIMRIGD